MDSHERPSSCCLSAGRSLRSSNFLLYRVTFMSRTPFFYNSAANVTDGEFGAVLVFAAAHCQPVVIHECPDLQEFQASHPGGNRPSFIQGLPPIFDRGRYTFFPLGACISPSASSGSSICSGHSGSCVGVLNIHEVPRPPHSIASDQASHESSSLLTHHSFSVSLTSCGGGILLRWSSLSGLLHRVLWGFVFL